MVPPHCSDGNKAGYSQLKGSFLEKDGSPDFDRLIFPCRTIQSEKDRNLNFHNQEYHLFKYDFSGFLNNRLPEDIKG